MSSRKKKKNTAQPLPAKESYTSSPWKPAQFFENHWKLFLAGILALTFIAYFPGLDNELTNWDDGKYIDDNFLIRNLSLKSIGDIFSTYYFGQYNPIQILTYAIEYHFVEKAPFLYHLDNHLLHLLNTALVFWLIYMVGSSYPVALLSTLLFGLHPIHVESVTWVSERKDLLYSFFYLSASVVYIHYYLKKGLQWKWFLPVMLLFGMGTLSKTTAVSLPILLLLFDFYFKRTFTLRTWLEKIPLVAISLLLGVVFVQAQKTVNAIQGFDEYSFFERLLIGCYGYSHYLFKLIIPHTLTTFYPYPGKVNGMLPVEFWLYPFLLATIAAYAVYSLKRTRKIFFSFMFFSITVALVLQILGSGEAVMADRYSYIPSIALFYILSEGLIVLQKRISPMVIGAVIVLYSGWFFIYTWKQCEIWTSSFTLWSDVIEKYPDSVPIAYNNRGNTYMGKKEYEHAIADYSDALRVKATHFEALYNRGLAYFNLNKNKEALADFNLAIKYRPDYKESFNNRGNTYYNLGMYDSAFADFNKAIALSPNYATAYFSRGNAYGKLGKYNLSLSDLNTAIAIDPMYAEAYNKRGVVYAIIGKMSQAFADFNKAVSLNPEYSETYYNMGITWHQLGKKSEACEAFRKGAALKHEISIKALNDLCK